MNQNNLKMHIVRDTTFENRNKRDDLWTHLFSKTIHGLLR